MFNLKKKHHQFVVWSATLDGCVFFSWQEPEKISLACGIVVYESQQLNLNWQCYILLEFTAILWFNLLPYCTKLLTKNSALPLTKYKISQNSANIHSSMPISLWYLATNLYTSAVDFVKFHRLLEEALERVFFEPHMIIS